MNPGQQFTFIVSKDIAGRMDRVIMINDGRIVSTENQASDMIYTVERI